MIIRILSWCMAVALTAAVGCGGHGAVVLSPQAVGAIPGDPVHTEQAILAALPRHRWAAQSVEPGRIVAFFQTGSHLLRVDIRHDAQQIAIYYLDSSNLAARIEPTGQIFAHPKVNVWIRTLSMDIASAVSTMARPSSLPPPPPQQYAPAGAPAAYQAPGAPPPYPPPAQTAPRK